MTRLSLGLFYFMLLGVPTVKDLYQHGMSTQKHL